jgi:tRNA G18 (ribose-2'-O)-methylase SpoU
VVEGALAVRQLLESRWPLLSLLLRPERVEALADVVAVAERGGAPVYVAGAATFDRVAGFPVHRGVLALAGRQPELDAIRLLAGVPAVVVVEGVNDHQNLGAIFRNAAALGAGAVLLDPSCCDPLYRRSVRVSVGHVLRVPFARLAPWPAALAQVAEAGFDIVAMDPAARDTIASVQPSRRVAVLVGAEGPGLSAAAAALATRRVRIPMAAGVDSLNVATALAIALDRLGSSANSAH